MTSRTRCPQELQERAVRLVLALRGDSPSEWAALDSISSKLGMTKETLQRWVPRAQVDGGLRSGVTSLERERIRELGRENRELPKTNKILIVASHFSLVSSTRVRPNREAPCPDEFAPGNCTDLPGAGVRAGKLLRRQHQVTFGPGASAPGV